jgi:putative Mg2+ transporter-C (MgtC) family protein
MLSDSELVLRLLLAALLGSVIGFERERLSWSAGLRTHMLVCVGACLLMIVSAFGFSDVLSVPHVVLDPSRVAAQVVSGIGFLGAGAILMRGEIVRGLTTAASVWAVAAVGLAVGGGLYFAACSATVIMLIILAGIKPLEERYKDRRHRCILRMRVKRGQMSIDLLRQTLREQTPRIQQFVVQHSGTDEEDDVTVALSRISRRAALDAMERLRGLPCVIELKEEIL